MDTDDAEPMQVELADSTDADHEKADTGAESAAARGKTRSSTIARAPSDAVTRLTSSKAKVAETRAPSRNGTGHRASTPPVAPPALPNTEKAAASAVALPRPNEEAEAEEAAHTSKEGSAVAEDESKDFLLPLPPPSPIDSSDPLAAPRYGRQHGTPVKSTNRIYTPAQGGRYQSRSTAGQRAGEEEADIGRGAGRHGRSDGGEGGEG